MPYCALRYCRNYVRSKFPGATSFHRFPWKCHEKREEWIKFVRKDRSEQSWVPSNSARICSLHFSEDDKRTSNSGRIYLKDSAVPIYNTTVPPASSSQQHEASVRSLFSSDTDDHNDSGDRSDEGSRESSRSIVSRKDIETTKLTASSAADKPDDLHEGFSCKICSGSIVGFRYVCVQCANYDFCAGCEARGEHSLHYVLRIPRLAPHAEVDAMLSKIRAHIVNGQETEQAEPGTDDRVVPALHQELVIKVEVEEELPDPLGHKDAFQPDDNYTEPAEVDAMLSKVRAHIVYGQESEHAEPGIDDRVVPALHQELAIKVEMEEELPDPVEHEDAFQPDDDNYTEPENNTRESTSKKQTLSPAPDNTSSTILTETERNYVIIEYPVKSIKTEPKTTKHKTTEPEHNGTEKRMKMYLEEQTRAIEALMDTPVDTAGPPTEGASWELPVIVKTEEEDEGSYQVFSHTSHKTLKEAKPGPVTEKKMSTTHPAKKWNELI